MSRAAPDNLTIPKYLLTHLGDRQRRVLDHGFGDDLIGTRWWDSALKEKGLSQSVRLVLHGEVVRLDRAELFRLGAETDNHDDLLTFVWHVLAWGTGASQRGNRRRIESFTTSLNSGANVSLLRSALEHARRGDPHTAYNTLVRPGRGAIHGLGPAFFTKLLYFASENIDPTDAQQTRCLILDARVASSLHQAGWTTLPHHGKNFSANWYTATYESYCELLKRWACEQSHHELSAHPDEIERALFEGPSTV